MKVLDSYALLAWLGNEQPAAETLQQLLDTAAAGEVDLLMSRINWGEVFYIIAKKYGGERAREIRRQLEKLPVELASATDARVTTASELKADYAFAYADAFAAGLALEHDAELVTGDPEFQPVEDREELSVLWVEAEI
jgi:ribonuclease VapC